MAPKKKVETQEQMQVETPVQKKPKKLTIKVKYHTDAGKIETFPVGDWIDLRSAETYYLDKGDYKNINLGISMKLPEGYEAHICPRSSTFDKWGILLVNGMGIIDNSYSGNNDVWGFPALAMRKTTIFKGDRICQFRIMKKMEPIEFEEVDYLPDKNRGGFGSTGKV